MLKKVKAPEQQLALPLGGGEMWDEVGLGAARGFAAPRAEVARGILLHLHSVSGMSLGVAVLDLGVELSSRGEFEQ
jgi:hypothetical protein